MTHKFFVGMLLCLVVPFLAGCVQTKSYVVEDNQRSAVGVSESPEQPQESRTALSTKKPIDRQEVEEKKGAPSPGKETPSSAPPENTPSPSSDQELLDSALDYCQTSNDYWERGDLDSALAALDKAYSLILKVNGEDDPEVLQQKEDLRFTISKRIIEVYSSRITVVNGLHKAIPLEMNEHVEKALDSFKTRERKFFLEAYRRSGKYRPAILEALSEAGLPEELSWLPLIESGFKIRALSRARALGMWQFIASTGYKYGLNRDSWIDERMDLEKSTQAAIAYLKELHQIFGDWTTVLAAYNCGEGTVLKKIRTQKINYLDHFWDLYQKLPNETASYVPRFMAVLHIINDPAAHGFSLPPVDTPVETEKVTINKQIPLKTIAKRLEISHRLLSELNAELRRDITPEDSYELIVPAGKGEALMTELRDIPVWCPPAPQYIIHKVRSRDTLSGIAARYRASITDIMAVNGLKNKSYLKVGWKLKIPTEKGFLPVKESQPAYVPKQGEKLGRYVVRRGDSLWTIANRHGTTTKAIRSINHLRTSKLSIGQVLMIPQDSETGPTGSSKDYTVQSGDSLYLIARKHKMNLSTFLELNKLTTHSTIFPGQVLQVSVE